MLTVVALWKWASDLEFMVYWQHQWLWKYLFERIKNRKEWSRSTQNVTIEKLIKEYWFIVVCPPEKTKEYILKLLINYQKDLINYVDKNAIRTIKDL